MLEEKDYQKLNAYFGFAVKKRATYVGMKLEEELSKKKIRLLLLLPSCSTKTEEEYQKYIKDNPKMIVYRYEGSYPVNFAIGYEKLKAVGITDDNLAKVILEELKKDVK